MPADTTRRCDSYNEGECTWGACKLALWVQDGWGNAVDWLTRAPQAGFAYTRVPTVGAIAVFGPGGPYDSVFGHLGLVTAVQDVEHFAVKEMNYSGFNVYDERWTTRYYLAYFILPPGVAAGEGPVSPPAPNLAPLDGFQAAWGQVQSFWNVEIERHVDHVQVTDALLRALAQG